MKTLLLILNYGTNYPINFGLAKHNSIVSLATVKTGVIARLGARILSVGFHPAFVQLALLFVFLPTQDASFYWSSIFWTAIIPLIFYLWYARFFQLEDIFIVPRKDRILPFLVTILGTALLFWTVHPYPESLFKQVLKFMLYSQAVWLLVTFTYKASLHISAATAFICYQYIIGVAAPQLVILQFITLGIIAWARLQLRAHTPMELLCGFLMAIGSSTIFYAAESQDLILLAGTHF